MSTNLNVKAGELNIRDALPQAATVGTTPTIVMQIFFRDGIPWSIHLVGTLPHRQQGSQGLRCFAP